MARRRFHRQAQLRLQSRRVLFERNSQPLILRPKAAVDKIDLLFAEAFGKSGEHRRHDSVALRHRQRAAFLDLEHIRQRFQTLAHKNAEQTSQRAPAAPFSEIRRVHTRDVRRCVHLRARKRCDHILRQLHLALDARLARIRRFSDCHASIG